MGMFGSRRTKIGVSKRRRGCNRKSFLFPAGVRKTAHPIGLNRNELHNICNGISRFSVLGLRKKGFVDWGMDGGDCSGRAGQGGSERWLLSSFRFVNRPQRNATQRKGRPPDSTDSGCWSASLGGGGPLPRCRGPITAKSSPMPALARPTLMAVGRSSAISPGRQRIAGAYSWQAGQSTTLPLLSWLCNFILSSSTSRDSLINHDSSIRPV